MVSGCDPISVMATLRAIYPDAEFVLLSSFPRWAAMSRYVDDRRVRICGKPYDIEPLVADNARLFSSAALPRK